MTAVVQGRQPSHLGGLAKPRVDRSWIALFRTAQRLIHPNPKDRKQLMDCIARVHTRHCVAKPKADRICYAMQGHTTPVLHA
jgi:hypothetical protein